MWVARGISGSTAAEEVVASAGADGAFALADAIVRVAREDLRLPHPQLFTARASGRGAAELAESLRLADADAPGGPDGRTDSGVRGGPDALRPVVVEAVGRMFGQEPGVDDDGDVYFTVAGTTVFVIFSPDGGLVQAWALVVRGVYSRRTTAVEVDLLGQQGDVEHLVPQRARRVPADHPPRAPALGGQHRGHAPRVREGPRTEPG